MKSLIILIIANLAVAMLVAISMVASDTEWLVVYATGVLSFMAFGCLAFVNLGYIFFGWKKQRWRAFLPLASYVLSAGLAVLVMDYGAKLIWRNTPFQPDTFLNGQRRADLTAVAIALDGKGYAQIRVPPGEPLMVTMLDGRPRREVDTQVIATMKQYGFTVADMDDAQGIIQLEFYNGYHCYEYIWSKPDLAAPDGLSSAIFDEQVHWNNLTAIIRHVQSGKSANRMPERFKMPFNFRFSLLKATLGDDLVNRLAAIEPGQPVGETDRKAVLIALNRQRLPSSRLLEIPIITYENWDMHGFKEEGLCLNGLKYRGGWDGFWEVDQVKQVLDAGLVFHAPDGKHLKIKEGLSPQQSYEVEWAQVAIMAFAYEGMLTKSRLPILKSLGDHWYYFCR